MEKFCLKINKRLLPLKIHFFLFFAALAGALPFRTVFAKQLGISATAVGVIFCAVPVMKIITNPLFGFLGDYFKRFRLILSIIMIFVATSHVAITFIPSKSSVLQDTADAFRRDFHSKLSYLSTNDSIHPSCHPKLTLNIEYMLPQDSNTEPYSFACDIQCSKIETYYRRPERKRHCLMQMDYDFRMFFQMYDCDINVVLGETRLGILHTRTFHLVEKDMNGVVGRKVMSSFPSSENCSSEHANFLPFSSKHTRNTEKKLNNENVPKVVDVEDNFNISMGSVNNNIAENSTSSIKKYYAQYEYIIEMHDKDFCMKFCSQDFDCHAKKCFLHEKMINDNTELYIDEENEFLSSQFRYFFVLMIISCTTLSGIIFLMDAMTYELLNETGGKYGEQRLWGTVGWGMGALIGGCLNQIVTSDSAEINYAPSFYLLGVICLIDLIPIYHLKVTHLQYSPNICKDVCLLLSKIDILYNIVVVFIIGILSGFIWHYQFWFMEELGSSQVLLGLSQTFECMFEVPCFIASGWIIMKIGHSHCNSIAFLCFGLRYLCFAVMYDPWWTLAVALFHGPTFGIFYASMTLYAKNEAPAGTEATVQSLLHLCFEGLGVATGSLLGGVGIDKLGSRMTFFFGAAASFILLFANIIATFLLSKVKKENKRESTFVLQEIAD